MSQCRERAGTRRVPDALPKAVGAELMSTETDEHVALVGDARSRRDGSSTFQRRRAQTEGGWRSLKTNFSVDQCALTGLRTAACKWFWGVLTHDVWVLAEKLRQQRKTQEQKLREVD